jgi:hypothetical protein
MVNRRGKDGANHYKLHSMFLVATSFGKGDNFEHLSIEVFESFDEAQQCVDAAQPAHDERGRRYHNWHFVQIVIPGEDFSPVPDEFI